MDLKDFFSGNIKQKDFYWALVLEPGWVQAAIWTIGEGRAKAISISSSTAWETDGDLIGAADTALSSAVQNLPEEISEPVKTVFGVPTTWVKNGEIKEEYLGKIKKICGDLSLEPSGFVVLSEAIAHYTKSEEGAPLNAIVLGVGKEEIEVTLFKSGKPTSNAMIARSVSISDDVFEGLARFKIGEPYPSRFLIYNGKKGELEDIKQSLLNADWDRNEKIKFLHTPQIEIISPENKVIATALAGASEVSEVSKISTLADEEGSEYPSDVENVSTPKTPIKAEDLGFMVGEDIASKKEGKGQKTSPLSEKVQQPQQVSVPKVEKTKPSLNLTKKFSSLFTSLKRKLFLFSSKVFKTKNTLLYGAIIFVTLLVVGFVLWWFLPKATVTVYLSPKKLEDELALVVSTSSSSDIEKSILTGEEVSTDVLGEKTTSTTGKKTVGEKSRGTAKIQNGTSSVINLKQGTILVAANDLQFTIDNSASISAALSPSLPGETNVDVTAYDIGAQYNLAKDEVFKVANYLKAEVDAVILVDFAGGSSREISAVSEEDREKLEEELRDELLVKALAELKQGLGENNYLIEESLDYEILERSFNGKVGDEASNVKLTLELSFKGVVISREEFFDFVKTTLESKLPSGYVLRNDQVSFKFDLKDGEDEEFEFEVATIINLLPRIDVEEVKEKIKGRDSKVVERYFETIPGFSRAGIMFSPKLPGKLGTLPHVAKNISIELSTER